MKRAILKGFGWKWFFEKRFWRLVVFEDCIFYFIKNVISLKALEHDPLKTEKSKLKTCLYFFTIKNEHIER